MNNNDERDYAEESANRAEMRDESEHCHGECKNTYDDETHELIGEGDDCAHCGCCCSCLSCIYAPSDGMPLTAEQRAPIADIPPNAGSAS